MELTVEISTEPNVQTSLSGKKRPEKGKSLLALPDDYTVIDIETTGLDTNYDNIIEISALRIRDRVVSDRFSYLVKPPIIKTDKGHYYIDAFIENLTGITNEMLENAPDQREVLPLFMNFIGCDVLVGYNVNFDINFLYDAILYERSGVLNNDFIDAMRFSRRLFPELDHHRLSDTAEACSVSYDGAHRSLKDCEITFECFETMRQIIFSKTGNGDFKQLFPVYHGKINCSKITAQTDTFNEDHPFYKKTVVFTGALSGMSRKDAMQLVVNAGGYIANTITKKTNYLVVGAIDYIKNKKSDKTIKIKNAEKLISEGQDLVMISEETFYSLIQFDLEE